MDFYTATNPRIPPLTRCDSARWCKEPALRPICEAISTKMITTPPCQFATNLDSFKTLLLGVISPEQSTPSGLKSYYVVVAVFDSRLYRTFFI